MTIKGHCSEINCPKGNNAAIIFKQDTMIAARMTVAAERTMITAEVPMIAAEKRGIAIGVTIVAALQGHLVVSLALRQFAVLNQSAATIGLSLWPVSLRHQPSLSQSLACQPE